jgi:hypothetical protein
MRELTAVEMQLVAGGSFMVSDPEEEKAWWEHAFDDLSDGLAAIQLAFGGIVGLSIQAYREAIEHLRDTGGLVDGREAAYNQYMYEATGNPAYLEGGGGQ